MEIKIIKTACPKEKPDSNTLGFGQIGEVTQMLYDTLTGIQWGKIKDTFGWTKEI